MSRGGIAAHELPGQGATNDWLTPQWILDALRPFDLDPCASESNPTRVATAIDARCGGSAFCCGRSSAWERERGETMKP